MSCFEEGFRLAGVPSECSLKSKARIDALFEDSRSICSSTLGGWWTQISTMASTNPDELGADEQRRINSAVQARIEAMFASVEAESGTPAEYAASIISVKYLGAAPVGGRVASVHGLQEPLRQLIERLEDSIAAELEVSRRGLTFRTSVTSEKINPFRRIAVWSAVKLRSKKTVSGDVYHAFLPLVGDDQGPSCEHKHAELYRTMRELKGNAEDYPPIFAVIMRRPGAARLLECHAFACQVEEDAVAAAATLYRALLADLDANRRRPRHTNGVGCISLASVASSVRNPSSSSRYNNNNSINFGPPPMRPLAPHPVRPPRLKKNSLSNVSIEDTSSLSNLEKFTRRKKNRSDVKAEDILEARNRDRPFELEASWRDFRNSRRSSYASNSIQGNNKNWIIMEGLEQAVPLLSKEEKENFRNKVYGVRQEMDAYGKRIEQSIRIEQDEKVYGKTDKNVNEVGERKLNNYEKLPTRIKSCDLDKSSDRNSTIRGNSESSYCGTRNNARENQIYGRNEGSYDFERNNSRFTGMSRRQETYSSKREDIKVYDGKEETTVYGKNTENGIYDQKQSSKRRSEEMLYKEHFKDAEKIYTLSQEEVPTSKSNDVGQGIKTQNLNQENVVEDKTSKNKRINQYPSREEIIASKSVKTNQNCPGCGERENNLYSDKRIGKISTMNKPLKKQQQDNPTIVKIPEYSQPRMRKGSRAESEPPRSRLEEVSKNLQENRLKRAQSDLDVDKGDLMTRVELPRRGSFLKSGSTRKPNNFIGGTPLGFTELFDEFRNQEGLTSVDDILAAIIDPEGMSFNDLKPLYKEFLLKLAATLTKDELYQRSASIMRRRRRPQRRRSTRRPCLLGRAIKKSVSRLKGGPTEFTSVIFPARRLNDSFGSSSSCDVKNHQRNRVPASRTSRRRSSWRRLNTGPGQTTSEDSDTCRRRGRGANRSSSGYVSCSECSYDSESCTCIRADKCYCSLSRKVPIPSVPAATIVCACDTDSCSESNKCYCGRKGTHPTILEQLRQRGIIPSESTLSRGGSPERVRTSRTCRSHASSKSLEFLKIRPPSTPASSDNLALDYDLFSPGKNARHSSNNEKVLVVSARDPQGRLIYVGGSERDRRLSSNSASRSEAHHEVLSIKKSAEIAAVFGRGSARTCKKANSVSSAKNSVSMEAGLGYLP